jgi:omega-6 fatty acid desaturase (delta-12 desaturase)
MFGLGPLYLFLLRNRLPLGFMRAGWRPWFSTMATNVAIAAVVVLMIWAVGLEHFLLIQVPIVLLGAAAGIWLFYVQHQFRETSCLGKRLGREVKAGTCMTPRSMEARTTIFRTL